MCAQFLRKSFRVIKIIRKRWLEARRDDQWGLELINWNLIYDSAYLIRERSFVIDLVYIVMQSQSAPDNVRSVNDLIYYFQPHHPHLTRLDIIYLHWYTLGWSSSPSASIHQHGTISPDCRPSPNFQAPLKTTTTRRHTLSSHGKYYTPIVNACLLTNHPVIQLAPIIIIGRYQHPT